MPNGDVVVVRDVLEKISRWLNRFKETGDVIAQYDPAHLSLPWAAFRFLLQTAVSEAQVFGAMAYDRKLQHKETLTAHTREECSIRVESELS